MTISSSSLVSATRVGLCVAVVILTGCQSAHHPIAVTSPAPPLVGSAPISAHDAYGRIFVPMTSAPGESVAQVSTR
jgi:uncharacterized lipoprotein YajG